jgi:signal transduction histidine kinase
MTTGVPRPFFDRLRSLNFQITSAFILAILTVTLGVAGLELRDGLNRHKDNILASESARVETASQTFELWVMKARRDIRILGETPPISGIVRATEAQGGFDMVGLTHLETWKRRLENVFISFLMADPEYAQLRFIGVADNGQELVRVQRENQEIVITDAAGLQHKAHRDYFQEGLRLQPGEVLVSRISLNQENGRVEEPHWPTLRLMTGAFTATGDLFGMIVVNLRVGQILETLAAGAPSYSTRYLLNSTGDFLLHPDPDWTFGFDLGHRYTWKDHAPEIDLGTIAARQGEADGQFLRDTHAFDENYLTTREVRLDPNDAGKDLTLVLEVSRSALQDLSGVTLGSVTVATAGIALLLGGLVTFYLSKVLQPLNQLTGSVQNVGAGNFEVTLPQTKVLEIRTLVHAFRQMIDGIRARDRSIEESSAKIRQLNEGLQARLTASNQRAALATAAVGIGVWDIDLGTGQLACDDSALQMLGIEPSDDTLNLDTLLQSIHPDDSPSVATAIDTAIRQGTELSAIFRIVAPDTKLRTLEARAAVVRNPRNTDKLLRGVLIDVTEAHSTALAYKVLNEEATSFAYAVSHDLRAPLRSMNGFAVALKDEYADSLDETASDYIDRISKAAVRMGVLIDDMLKLSQISKTEIHRKTLNLSEIAEEIVSELRAAEPGRQVTVDIASGLFTVTDPGMARIILWNLLGNAWKYSRDFDPATITVDRTTRDGRPVFVVRDTGMGFDMAYADKLFKPFQRLHSDRSIEGTGIGLATVQRAISRLGGTIDAESTLGQGATMYFTL